MPGFLSDIKKHFFRIHLQELQNVPSFLLSLEQQLEMPQSNFPRLHHRITAAGIEFGISS